MDESKLRHLIDYETLKEWGFEWGMYQNFNGQEVVMNYVAQTRHTDLHGFEPIMLMWVAHPNCNVMWLMSTMAKKKKDVEELFRGVIRSKTALQYILKSILIFKPNNKEE